MRVPLSDLKAQYASTKDEIRRTKNEACESQLFAPGPAAEEFEEKVCVEVLLLPVYPGLSEQQIEYVGKTVLKFYGMN